MNDQREAHAGALSDYREREEGLLDAVGALLRTNDELAAFAGRVAHDLRAPLTATLGFLSLADGPLRGQTSDAAAECVRSARGAAVRMQALVDDLLAYATFTARPRIGPVPLPSLVEDVVADVGAAGRVTYDGPEHVRSDATLLRQLVQNLVGNAMNHAGPDARIVVSAAIEENGAWWLRVVDNGPGIPPDARATVFEPFVRIGRGGGSGLGLATCVRIVDALGGRIAVDDADPHGAPPGAAFTAAFRRPAA